jgi:hypothetical protein
MCNDFEQVASQQAPTYELPLARIQMKEKIEQSCLYSRDWEQSSAVLARLH